MFSNFKDVYNTYTYILYLFDLKKLINLIFHKEIERSFSTHDGITVDQVCIIQFNSANNLCITNYVNERQVRVDNTFN